MIYRPTFRHMRIFVWFLSALGIGIVALGFAIHNVWLVIVIPLFVVYGCCARYMTSITLTDEGIKYKGIIKRWYIGWHEIRHLKKMQDYGWPYDRVYGGATYEIKTDHGRRIVGLLEFPDCLSAIEEKMRQMKEQRRAR